MGRAKPSSHKWPEVDVGSQLTTGPLTVFPIHDGDGSHPGDYGLLAAAVEAGLAKVTEVNKEGNVPVIQIENRGKHPLLGIQGEEYVGAKQNRTLNISVLAAPGKTHIPVTCVEMGRWDSGPMSFTAGSYETMNLRAMKMAGIHMSSKTIGHKLRKFLADQGKVWESVRGSSARHRVNSATMAMFDIYASKDVSKDLNDITAGIKLPERTRGAVIGIGGRVVACDIIESEWAFRRIWPRLLQSYALSAIGSEGLPPSAEAAESFVRKPLHEIPHATSSVGLGDDVRWESKDFLSTALVWKDRYLHATIFSRDLA